MIHNLEGRLFTTFQVVLEEKSFNKASVRLGYTQSTVSAHIALLEDAVEKKLFDRLSNGVIPTEAGRELAKYAYRFLELAEEMYDAINSLDKPKGLVKICALETFHVSKMPSLIQEFVSIYPEITFYLEIGFLHDIAVQVMRKEVDFGIVPKDPEFKELDFIPLYEEELFFIASKHYFINFGGGLGKPQQQVQVIEFGHYCVFGDFVTEALADAGIHEKKRMEFSSTEAIKKMVALGLGIALIPRSSVEQELLSGCLVIISFLPTFALTTGIIFLKGRKLNRSAHLAKEFLIKTLKK